MSHSIPVFFFPVSNEELPDTLDHWYSVEKLLREKWDNREQSGLRTSTSRNWWHQHAVSLICKQLQISGLEFLQQEIVCLNIEQIRGSIPALDKLINSCVDGLPELTTEVEETGSIWFLRNYYEGDKVKKFSITQIEKAYGEASTVHETKEMADIGYNSLVGFFSFLKSLRATLEECLSENKKLLYVRPQP